ncbi:MAG: tetratricopeptide repeat protein [Alphaproteobacteria bacterium]|jgi:hypothetical protein|nr:hypothetical protein [Rhodospirillaceae bacterium]MDP6404198.1 tetratricopeptide repeat protein [Alphaproteobacteria bacterium]MDP6623393.1 tetratricopeptide repeat protein [Alphaproteobacteria bacterium]|tara:strand:+ start:1267 stop:1773 length:507 start_codon:yes stop_codon:yes gene_type:complete
MRKTLFALLPCLLLALPSAARADYESAVLSYDKGRYDVALRDFRPLSETGHSGAEFMLGAMYFYGRGVTRNDGLAAIWFFKAANQGHPGAQLAFGSMHIRGIGVRQDLITAYTWLSLTMRSAIPTLVHQATLLRDEAAQLMTPQEIEAARAKAADWSATPAGLTRWRR